MFLSVGEIERLCLFCTTRWLVVSSFAAVRSQEVQALQHRIEEQERTIQEMLRSAEDGRNRSVGCDGCPVKRAKSERYID